MSSPQVENGHVRIANEIWEALTAIRIPGEASQILFFIIRKTWGWKKKVDKISLSQFQKATGLKKPNIIKARNKLKEMNLIIVTQKDNDNMPTYCINDNYNSWKPLPKKITDVMQKDNKSLCKKLPTKDKKKDTSTRSKPPIIPQNKIQAIFNYWNSLNGPVKHKKINEFEDSIKTRLKDYSVYEIMDAMRNYAKILNDENFTWSYRYTLNAFLERKTNNIDRFATANDPFSSMPKVKSVFKEDAIERQLREIHQSKEKENA